MADDNSTPSNNSSSLFPNEPRPTGRPVYESNLLPARKRRRFSPWLIIPGLLVILLAVFYFLVFGPKPRRFVGTAGTVVFASDQNSPGITHLWMMQADGTGSKPLTTGMASDTNPAFTADGNQLAFLSNRSGGPNQIWIVDSDGKNAVQVTRTAGAKTDEKFAPGSNSLLGFLSGASLAVEDVGKGEATLLLPTPATSTHSSSTRPSPIPGSRVRRRVVCLEAVCRQSEQRLKHSRTGGRAGNRRCSNACCAADLVVCAPTHPKRPAEWAAACRRRPAFTSLCPGRLKDGSWYASCAGPAGRPEISGLIQFDGSGTVQKPIVPPQKDAAIGPQEPVYSPDGTQIAVEVWRQTDLASRRVLGLFIVDADGTGTPHLLARGDAEAAQFSPDGKQVFFLARRADSGHDLYRINADGTGPLRLSDGHADITSFALSPQSTAP